MPKIFGIDIAQTLYQSVKKAGGLRPGVLEKTVSGSRTTGSLTAGNNPTNTTHTCEATVATASKRDGETTASTITGTVDILGASIVPAAAPASGDVVTIDGVRYTITGFEVDEALALYECSVQA